VLEMALSNEKIVREQNIMLEQKVKERTNDLEETVSKLDNAYSNLKEAQSQLVNKEKMASLGQLTAGIAHEINNPINFISGSITPLTRDIEEIIELFDETDKLAKERFSPEEYAQIEDLKEDLDYEYLKTEIDELLKGMNDGSKRTVSIIRGLKTFSRVDESDTKSVDIHDNIESTLVLINNQIKNSIEVIRNYGSLPMVECFAGQINQVFLNLINNAAQAINEAKEESEKGTIWITTSFQETDQTVQISIKDNGPGIPDEIIDRIFDPFFTTKDVGEGTGLGLSISYNIIEKHGGELKVKTEAGKGTEFVITLPLSPKPKK
jgi:signal transduction histidine kinase